VVSNRRELLTDPHARIDPHSSIPVPHRFTSRPIAIRRRGNVHRLRWWIVARACDRGSDNRPGGKATYQPGRNISAASPRRRVCITGGERYRRYCHKQKSFHLLTLDDESQAPR
jgi:hypothetical protein